GPGCASHGRGEAVNCDARVGLAIDQRILLREKQRTVGPGAGRPQRGQREGGRVGSSTIGFGFDGRSLRLPPRPGPPRGGSRSERNGKDTSPTRPSPHRARGDAGGGAAWEPRRPVSFPRGDPFGSPRPWARARGGAEA